MPLWNGLAERIVRREVVVLCGDQAGGRLKPFCPPSIVSGLREAAETAADDSVRRQSGRRSRRAAATRANRRLWPCVDVHSRRRTIARRAP